jgi:amino acid adenylation domain-containing protein
MPGPKKQEFLRGLNRRLREESEPVSSGRQTLQGRLAASFAKAGRGSGAAIRYKDRVITYKHLHEQTNAIAKWLIHERRVQPETFVGVLLEDRADVIASVIGILKARCVFVPLDADYPHSRLETMIRAVDIRYVITDSANAGGKWDLWADPGKSPELIHWDKLHSSHARGRFFDRSPQLSYLPPDNIYIYFTSGSTGIPRAMMGVNRSLLHFIHWEIETFCVDETSRFSQLTTPVFDAFLRDIFVPLCSGGVICIPGSKDTVQTPVQLARWLDESQITMMHCVPGILRSLNSAELSPGYFRELKFILLSGEKLEPPDLADWYAVFQDRIQLVNLWGTSETTLAKTCYFVQPPDAGRERIPVGKPINGAGVITLDEEGEICDPLVSGGLYILTPFRTAGYLNDPGLNNERFISAPFDGYQRVKEAEEYDFRLHKTGDLGRLLPDGNIDVLGRNDRQVKIRGIRVELEEIERVLVKHPLLMEAAVLMKEISAGSEILCGYITGKTGIPGLVDLVREYLSARLPDYMVPAKLAVLDKLPRKPNGKIDYHALPDMMEGEQTGSRKPRNKVEAKLLELWTGILKIENIAINRSFFELGGNSLNIMTLISRIHQEFDIRISLAEIFNNNTIEKQASIVMAARKVQYESIEPMEQKEYYELSAAQKRLYFVQQLDPGSISYNMLLTVILESKMEKNGLENVFERLIRRHESIRTSYIWVHEKPVQKVRDNVDFEIEYYELSASGEAGEPAEKIVKAFIRPFDLSCAPLLRVGLIKIGSQSHILMVDMHHIISDGTSMEILKEEFMAVYQGKELAPLRLQYKDYSHWQNKQIDSPGMERQKAYWLNQFEGGVPTLHFLTDYPREGVENFEGEFVTFPIEEGLTRRLRELTNETGTTLYIVLLTVYMILLSKYTGQEDIIVGSGIAGRNHVDLDNIIGIFINMLAMRGQPVKSKTFGELLEEVREHSLAAFENQDYQFDELVRELGIQRDWKRNPLFDTQFTFQNMETGLVDGQVNDTEIQRYEYKNRSMPFDLSLNGMEIGERIGMSLGYVSAFFKRSTIERTAVHYIEILEQVLENRNIRLEDISLSHEMVIGRTTFSQDEYTGGFEF